MGLTRFVGAIAGLGLMFTATMIYRIRKDWEIRLAAGLMYLVGLLLYIDAIR